jgi:hypothetical protein
MKWRFSAEAALARNVATQRPYYPGISMGRWMLILGFAGLSLMLFGRFLPGPYVGFLVSALLLAMSLVMWHVMGESPPVAIRRRDELAFRVLALGIIGWVIFAVVVKIRKILSEERGTLDTVSRTLNVVCVLWLVMVVSLRIMLSSRGRARKADGANGTRRRGTS